MMGETCVEIACFEVIAAEGKVRKRIDPAVTPQNVGRTLELAAFDQRQAAGQHHGPEPVFAFFEQGNEPPQLIFQAFKIFAEHAPIVGIKKPARGGLCEDLNALAAAAAQTQ